MHILRLAIVTAAAASAHLAHASSSPALFSPIVRVNAAVATETRALATDVTSAIGRVWVRPPDVVTDQPDWSLKSSPSRACPRFSDMDFATTPDLPEQGAHELSVVFVGRSRSAAPGPDVFLFSLWPDPARAGVRPVYVAPDGAVTKGPRFPLDADAVATIRIAGRTFFGLGVDVDAFAAAQPPEASCAGLILDYDRAPDAFAPVKIMLVEHSIAGGASASFLRQALAASNAFWNPGRTQLFSSGAPFRDDPGGPTPGPRPPADQPDPDDPEVPAPGPVSLALIAASIAAARRRRAD